MQNFVIKRGDSRPTLRHSIDVKQEDLVGAAVTALFRSASGEVLALSGDAMILAEDSWPYLEYLWDVGDTATAGAFYLEFEITYADGGVQTFPTTGAIAVKIAEDIRAAGAAASGPVPQSETVPDITGTAQAGQSLTAVDAGWTNGPILERQLRWLRGTTQIAGAMGATYVPVQADVGVTLMLQERARNTNGWSAWASSAPTAVVAAAQVVNVGPTIVTAASYTETDGGATVTYTFTPPVVAGNPAPTGTRVLTLNGTDVTDAMTGNTYVATKTGATQTLVMTYTVQNSVSTITTLPITRTVPIAPVVNVGPSITTAPSVASVDGGATVTYTFTPPVVEGTPAPTVTRVLTLNDTDVTGAMTGNSYVATKTGATQALVMTYTVSNIVSSVTATPITRTVPAAAGNLVPASAVAPVITGSPVEGQVLTVSGDTWTNGPVTRAFKWWRGALPTEIIGATASTYTLGSADVGYPVFATVTADNGTNTSAPAATLPTATVAAASPVAAGVVVVGIMGQSEAQFILGADTTWDAVPNVARPVITTPNMVMINAAVDTALPGTALDYRLTPVTTATVGNLATRTVSAGIGALSAALQHIMPGTQFAVVDLAVSGTGRQELLTDAALFNPNSGAPARGRTWAQFEGIINYARAQGYELDEIHESWYANDTGSIPNFLNKFGGFYMGENGNGTPANIGDVYEPASGLETAAKTLDHILWDRTAASNARGRGIFARDRTKLRVYLPYENMNEASVAGMRTFTGDTRVQTFATPPEPHWVMGARDSWHAVNNDPDGAIYTLFNYVPGFLKAAGMTVGQPQIVDTTVGPAGAYVDLTVSLPNGGNLTTIRALEGRAAPASPTADYQPVMGFEVQRLGDAVANKQAFIPAGVGSYASKFRGTVAITDAGTGTGAARTGTVRITPVDPIVSGDQLHYLSNNAATLIGGDNARRITHKTWLDALIETVPAWRNASAPTRYPGIPVAPLLTPLVLDATPPAANPLGTPVILNNTTGDTWITEVLNHETSAFTPSAAAGLYVVAIIGDRSSIDATRAAISSCTIGAAGRAAGTGTALTLVSDTKRNRSRVAVYRLDAAPSATPQTVEMGFAAPAPYTVRLMVLQIPNADIAAPVSVDPETWTIAVTSWEHTPTVASANNGVLYIHTIVSASGNLITSASDSTEVFAGNNGGTIAGSNYAMLRWKVPGAAGPQSERFDFAVASAQWAGVAIQIAPRP